MGTSPELENHLLPRPPSCRTVQPIKSLYSTTARVRILQAFLPTSTYEGFFYIASFLFCSARWELSVFLVFASGEARFELLLGFLCRLHSEFSRGISSPGPPTHHHTRVGAFCQHIVLAAGSPLRFASNFNPQTPSDLQEDPAGIRLSARLFTISFRFAFRLFTFSFRFSHIAPVQQSPFLRLYSAKNIKSQKYVIEGC